MRISTHSKQALVAALSVVVLGLAACGGGSSTTTSGLTKRAFVSDDFDGTIHIEDAQRDQESGFTVTVGAGPGFMALSPDKSFTAIVSASTNALVVVKNATEAVAGSVGLSAPSSSYVVLSDNSTILAAVHNLAPINSAQPPGAVAVVSVTTDTTTNPPTTTVALTGTVPVNIPSTVVLSPDDKNLLVFSGPGDQVDSFYVIDVASAKANPSTATVTPISDPENFSRPVSAVFSSDSTRAYILNCGPECGGTTAGVTVLDMTASPPAVLAKVPLDAATIGLLNGTNLYIAGTKSGAPGGGTLSILDTSNLAAPAVTVGISDGYHRQMEMASNNRLFVGAITCTNDPAVAHSGCLSMVNIGANPPTAVVENALGDTTGIAPIAARNIVYVIEGGELKIYDTTTDALTPQQIDVVGKAVDVKYVDK